MEILKQNKVRLVNYDRKITTGKNYHSTSGIYLTAAKLAQYRMVVENRREKIRDKK